MGMHVLIEWNLGPLASFMPARVQRNVKARVSTAIRDGLAVLEKDHKKVQFRRGAASEQNTSRDRVTWRTGQLARSYRIYYHKGDLFGYYGSELARARLLEEGGVVEAKGHLLTIPTEAAKVGVGMGISARNLDLEFMWGIYKKTGLKALGREGVVWFWLKERVEIPARPMLARTKFYRQAEVSEMIATALREGALGHGN